LEQALVLLSSLYPDRIVVLDTALKSAADSKDFKYKEKAFDLLWKMATDYWSVLAGGGGDTEARRVFGAAYAAQESESLTTQGEKRRTFHYNGEPIGMFRHLKIGIKPSLFETLRVHFEWFAKEKKIVIGHCGCHLDF
jgi:hypothetical protein